MPSISFFVPGRPVPKQSFRFGKAGAWQPSRVVSYAKRVRWVAEAAARRVRWVRPDESTPLSVTLFFGYARPKSAKKADRETTTLRVTVPDVDNATKAILDGCASLWLDDRQVARLTATKMTVPRGAEGVTLTLETLENEDDQSEILSSFAAARRRAGGTH